MLSPNPSPEFKVLMRIQRCIYDSWLKSNKINCHCLHEEDGTGQIKVQQLQTVDSLWAVDTVTTNKQETFKNKDYEKEHYIVNETFLKTDSRIILWFVNVNPLIK